MKMRAHALSGHSAFNRVQSPRYSGVPVRTISDETLTSAAGVDNLRAPCLPSRRDGSDSERVAVQREGEDGNGREIAGGRVASPRPFHVLRPPSC